MALATAVPTGTWTVDKVHSTIGFEVEHMVSTFRGRFEEYDAQLVNGKLAGTVAVPSVKVYDENLEAHLQSPDFFDAQVHPELRFESSDLAIEADMAGGERIGLALETTVDRREFGLNWNAPLPKGGFALGNDVTLVVALELVRAEA